MAPRDGSVQRESLLLGETHNRKYGIMNTVLSCGECRIMWTLWHQYYVVL